MRVYFDKHKGTLKSLSGKPSKHVIWGDWLDVADLPGDPGHYQVDWRVWNETSSSVTTEPYIVARSDCRATPLLEMMFLDVGQGDGCILNVPNGTTQDTLIIDAGQFSNLHQFLKWRFRFVDDRAAFHTCVLTHPDSDHYGGFRKIFDDQNITFGQVLHNGLVERKFGEELTLGSRADGFCTDIFETTADIQQLADPEARGTGDYARLLWTAAQRFPEIRMASTRHGEQVGDRAYVPGFAPAGGRASIEILGPVPSDHEGELALRDFGDKPNDGGFDRGKTKNGHSIILRLEYGGFSAIFGGDLNRPSEDHLLRHYGDIDGTASLASAIPAARRRLGADLLKCCHHGSADVTDEFLEAVNPFAFVVSSGDQESHVHPRPEVLGLLGKKGRGERPLVLCTEILRSTPGSLNLDAGAEAEHRKHLAAIEAATTADARKKAVKALDDFWKDATRRLVNVYGAINLRTDGQTLIVAFRKEKSTRGSPWQLFPYRLDSGEWRPLAGAATH